MFRRRLDHYGTWRTSKQLFHVNQSVNLSFTNTEVFENLVEHILHIDPPGDASECTGSEPQLLGDDLLASRC